MAYVLAVATTPRMEIEIELKVFDTEEYLRNYLAGIHLNYADIELLLAEGKLNLEDESFSICVVA